MIVDKGVFAMWQMKYKEILTIMTESFCHVILTWLIIASTGWKLFPFVILNIFE